MTKLSVNINKFATLRNARGGNNPDLLKIARDCQRFGAEGITIHPRPDERHITTLDVYNLKPLITTEYNIEGYPDERFIKLVADTKPEQATLVPDGPDVLTSNAGWDTKKYKSLLQDVIGKLKETGTRVSIFVNPDEELAAAAADTGADRIELYTENYAVEFKNNQEEAIAPYIRATNAALQRGLEINAGHDLDLENLRYFHLNIPQLAEVSIGHALVCDALYMGLENTIRLYLKELR
ncbi:pyridoxine 5'-phosphate synthase [Cryomorpha ignava]|uniref:Pyridoxine 5'-phosphate synthase n=1 Tax=Cryomorpha ignava TaxID=101383 RepID=A0A7K3WLT0_9FLAO|nr:pyridoxine 5'-phosphate synthase [Cryomorpha ignava]NEN21991.1 pyridoxine 5'-phosphate synthase [Cryomorpha ignava]